MLHRGMLGVLCPMPRQVAIVLGICVRSRLVARTSLFSRHDLGCPPKACVATLAKALPVCSQSALCMFGSCPTWTCLIALQALTELCYHCRSFRLEDGTGPQLYAADVVYAVTALLEAPPAVRPGDTAPADDKADHFWCACRLINTVFCKCTLLLSICLQRISLAAEGAHPSM